MKRILIVLTLAVVMLALPMSAVYASEPIPVEGTIVLIPGPFDVKVAGNSDNVILTMVVQDAWTGDIAGVSEPHEGIFVTHNWDPFLGPMNPDTWYNVRETITFMNVTVLGQSGSLTMKLNVDRNGGHWRIISGTGGLENLRGSGTTSNMNMSYSGQVHFDP